MSMAMMPCLPTFVKGNMKEMATKETVAIVGLPNEKYKTLIVKWAQENSRLLLIKRDNNGDLGIFSPDFLHSQPADIEVIACAKNGCWEADIIVLLGEESFERPLIERIREVATQKIVVEFSINDYSSEKSSFEATNLQQLLPNSKVVHVFKNVGSEEIFIAGDHIEANQLVSNKAKAIGYNPVIIDGFSSFIPNN